MNLPRDKSLLLIGCGYLGGFIIDRASKSYEKVFALVKSTNRIQELRNKINNVYALDIFAASTSLDELDVGADFETIFMIPPSAIGTEADGAREKIKRVVCQLQRKQCSKALLISSTGVYGNSQAEIVTAESAPAPVGERGSRLVAIEESWLAGGEKFSVLRLAGIYGPGRIIGRRPLSKGEFIGGKSEAWLNLIHVEDAASLSIRCLGEGACQVELGADGNPVRRGEYYQFVASALGLPAARFSDKLTSSESAYPRRLPHGKKCDPQSTFQRLQWQPRYTSYRSGLRASFDAIVEAGE